MPSDTQRSPEQLRILLVEDEALLLIDLEATIQDAGHAVCAKASDADQAIELARRLHPDLVLMDVQLAGGTCGIAAAAEIRRSLGIPCVFVSHFLVGPTLERARQAEPLAVLHKPCRPADLARVLSGLRLAPAAAMPGEPASFDARSQTPQPHTPQPQTPMPKGVSFCGK